MMQTKTVTNETTRIDERLTDRLWRLENLYRITDKTGTVTRFKLNGVQKELFHNIHPKNIICKSRQLGCSTFIALLFLDECLFRSNTSAAIVADKLENAKNIFKKIDFAWAAFPDDLKKILKLESTSDSATEMRFTNGSQMKVGTTLHSGTHNFLHISELGPLCAQSEEKAKEILKSALPTVPHDGGVIFIESTAEGEGNSFHEMWMEAEDAKEKNIPFVFYPHFFPWWRNPEYQVKTENPIPLNKELKTYFDDLERNLKTTFTTEQKNWYALTKKELKESMKEQHPSFADEAFASSGNKLFDVAMIERKLKEETRSPIEIINDWKIYAHYKSGHRYGIGADVGEGVGRDSSTGVVIDFTDNAVVATFRDNRITPDIFAQCLAQAGRWYGSCIIAPEANSVGYTTCVTLRNIYPQVYRQVLKGYVDEKQTSRLGWHTTIGTKPEMMYALSRAFEEEETPLTCPDATILREAKMFDRADLQATTKSQLDGATRHSDLLIATAIANQMRAYAQIAHGTPKNDFMIRRTRDFRATNKHRMR